MFTTRRRLGISFKGVSMPRKYISLGGWCGPALILGKLGLRTEAYPFDFSRCTLDGVLHFIRNGFAEGFYPPGPPPYRPECVGPWVLFRGQHTAFAHFNLNDTDVQAGFRKKFERFDHLLDSATTPVTFFRTISARHPAEELALAHELEATLRQRSPRLDFRVVFIAHAQGLCARSVELAPLSSRTTLWALGYTGISTDTLFDRAQHAYQDIVVRSVDEARWPAANVGCPPDPAGLGPADYNHARRVLLTDPTLRPAGAVVPLQSLTADRFPWRSHDTIALIDGVASVGGTCTGVGSTRMLADARVPGARRCLYCGSPDYHLAGRPFVSGRPFTAEEDQLLLVHLYYILTGGDKVAAVEQLAHEMHRGTFEVICRIQHLTNSSTKLMDSIDPVLPQ